MNKRVMYILNYPGKGGTEKYVLDMMTAVGFENCILVHSEEGPGLEIFRKTGAATFRVSMRHPFDLKAARNIKKIVHDEGIDVIHAQFLRENYIALLAKMLGAKVKVIWTYHVDVAMNSLIRNLNGIMTKFNSKVIAVSKFMLSQLEAKGIPIDKLKLIYNGVKSPTGVISDFNREASVITVIGRLREEKGQGFLIRSLHYLSEHSPELNWKCHIYGEGPDEQKLRLLIKEFQLDDRVILNGFSNDKEEMYTTSDIIVIPSSNEALSYVAIEALSFGRVVVATNVGGLPEVVKNKETGLLVTYDDVQDLAEQLKKLLTNKELMAILSDNGKKYFQDNFTFEKMVRETINLYKE